MEYGDPLVSLDVEVDVALQKNAETAAKLGFTPPQSDDILAHAWAQCRSNQGAPGVDGQDFADVEAYGVERWLGELALAHAEGPAAEDALAASRGELEKSEAAKTIQATLKKK